MSCNQTKKPFPYEFSRQKDLHELGNIGCIENQIGFRTFKPPDIAKDNQCKIIYFMRLPFFVGKIREINVH